MQLKHIIIAALSIPAMAHADDWTGRDKALHFTGGAAISSAMMLATKDERAAVLMGCGVGLAKELVDRNRPNHTASAKDFIVTCAGAYIGTKATSFAMTSTGVIVKFKF